MKKTALGMLLVMIIVEPLMFVLDWTIAPHLFIRTLLTFAISKLVADGVGKWVLRWPGHQWIYWRDYLNNEFVSKSEAVIFVALFWSAIGAILQAGTIITTPPWLLQIGTSSLVPSFIAIAPKVKGLEPDQRANRRLKSKL